MVAPVLRLLSVLFWTFFVLSSVVLFGGAVLIRLVTAPFDRERRVLHLYSCAWAGLYTWLNPLWRVRVEGRERIEPDEAYVLVANHQSAVDILVLFRLFRHFKWVSKIENFRVPLIGWNMSLNAYIPLRRGDTGSIREMMKACERTLARGSSVLLFPEGTRSPDGRLQSFSSGAFKLAQGAGVSVVPIAIRGTAAALPKHGAVLAPSRIVVSVLEPVEPDAGESPKAMARRVRRLLACALDQQVVLERV